MKAKQTKSEVAPPSNSFLRNLSEIRKGDLVSEASNELAKLVKEVRNTGRSGALTITLKVRASGDAMEIVGTAVPKMPKPETRPTTFFDTEDGGLQRDNPDQPEMFTTLPGGKEDVAQELANAVNA